MRIDEIRWNGLLFLLLTCRLADFISVCLSLDAVISSLASAVSTLIRSGGFGLGLGPGSLSLATFRALLLYARARVRA